MHEGLPCGNSDVRQDYECKMKIMLDTLFLKMALYDKTRL